MSTGTNKGSQAVQFQFEDPLIATEFNTHLHKVLLTGIYDGGLLTKVSDSIVTVSTWVATLTDGTYTITARSTTTYNVTGVSSTDRNIVLRWTWSATAAWYVDVLAVSDGSVQSNDVVIGRAVYSGATLTGFTYSNRTVPNTYSPFFLKVVPDDPASMRVRVLQGRGNYGVSNLIVSDQFTSNLTAPTTNPRIDVVYLDSDGVVKVFTGTEAASPSAPSYQNKIVLAEIDMTVGMTTIPATSIRDVRGLVASQFDNTVIPIRTNWPIFQVRRANPQQAFSNSGASGLPEKVQFNSVEVDTISGWSMVDYRWTPNVAGIYRFFLMANMHVGTAHLPAHVYCFIAKNGSELCDGSDSITSGYASTVEFSVPTEVIVAMNGTTDYIEFKIFQVNTAGTTMSTSGNAFAGGALIARTS